MANLYEPTEEQLADWAAWCADRPEAVRKVAERLVPWKLWLNPPSGHRMRIHSFQEGDDGAISVTALVLAEDNLVMFERRVFGLRPDDLIECDRPDGGELVGNLAIEPPLRIRKVERLPEGGAVVTVYNPTNEEIAPKLITEVRQVHTPDGRFVCVVGPKADA